MVDTEHNAEKPSSTSGLFATLAGLLRAKGTGVSSQLGVAITLIAFLALLFTATANAAIRHEYLPALSAHATAGVPAGFCTTAPETEPPCVPGPVGDVGSIAGDGAGHIWLADKKTGGSWRVDRFDAATGLFSGRQLDGEGGVSEMGNFGTGIGVGDASGEEDVYVGATKAGVVAQGVVAVYGPTDKLLNVWEGAHRQNKSFTLGEVENAKKEKVKERVAAITGVAVDDSKNFETQGDVYVATRRNGLKQSQALNVVNVLRPESGSKGAEPAGVVAELRGTCPAAAKGAVCTPEEQAAHPFAEPEGVAVSPFNGDLLVIDGGTERCRAVPGACVVDVFEPLPMGAYSFAFAISGANGAKFQTGRLHVSVDPSNGHIYVPEGASGVLDEFSETGAYLGQLQGTPTGPTGAFQSFKELSGVAVEAEHVFVGDFDHKHEAGIVDVFGPDIVIPDVEVLEPPFTLTPKSAVLRGNVNPDAAGSATCAFEYGTSTAYGTTVECAGAGSAKTPIPSENKNVEVKSGEIAGLEPDTTYFYRLSATSNEHPQIPNTGECPADCGSFTTPGPGLHGAWSAEVASTSGTLGALIDPNGGATSYSTSSTARAAHTARRSPPNPPRSERAAKTCACSSTSRASRPPPPTTTAWSLSAKSPWSWKARAKPSGRPSKVWIKRSRRRGPVGRSCCPTDASGNLSPHPTSTVRRWGG